MCVCFVGHFVISLAVNPYRLSTQRRAGTGLGQYFCISWVMADPEVRKLSNVRAEDRNQIIKKCN
jgi:hypothetical protein